MKVPGKTDKCCFCDYKCPTPTEQEEKDRETGFGLLDNLWDHIEEAHPLAYELLSWRSEWSGCQCTEKVRSSLIEAWTYVCDRKYSIVWASVPKLMACHWMWCDLWQLHFGNNFTACSLLELIMLCSIKLLILYDKYDEYDEYDKVNRCLARYSPRATTTNQPTNRAPNGPARPGKNAKFGRSWAKNDQKCIFWTNFGRFYGSK